MHAGNLGKIPIPVGMSNTRACFVYSRSFLIFSYQKNIKKYIDFYEIINILHIASVKKEVSTNT
jgi:hypothetical protein